MCTVPEIPELSIPPAKRTSAWRGKTAAAAAAAGDGRDSVVHDASCAWNTSTVLERERSASAPPAKRMIPPPYGWNVRDWRFKRSGKL
jgi:hypothetical protein